MADGPVTVQCPDCGVSSEVADLGLSRWGCDNCGWAYFLRRCSACGQAGYVTAIQGWHQPWQCVWCAEFNSGFSHYHDPATATIAELAEDIARRRLSPAPAPAPSPVPIPVPSPVPIPVPSPAPVPVPTPPRSLESLDSLDSPEPTDSVTQPIPVGTWIAHDRVPEAPPRPWHRMRRVLAPVLAAAAIVVAAALVIIAARPVSAGSEHATGMSGVSEVSGVSVPRTPGAGTRAVSVIAEQANAVDFQGVPGQLTIVAADTGQVTLTGQLHWTGRPPTVVTRLDRGSHVLLLSYHCAPASPCTENYRLTVPRYTAIALRQPPGQITLSGLAGPLRITASGVHISATGLRSATLLAKITSGDLNASFAAPPSRVAVTLVSAQATLGLPRRASYRISQQVAEGYVQVDIPQNPAALRTVTVRIKSGELSLLPELPGLRANPIPDGTRNHRRWRAECHPVPAGQHGRGRSKEAHVG